MTGPNSTPPNARYCRPLHGTQSLTVHNTATLSIDQFNEVLIGLQRSLEHLRQQTVPTVDGATGRFPPLPPPYEAVVRHVDSLQSL